MKKLIFFLFIFFLVATISFISAEVEETFPYHDKFDLKRPCFLNGTYCSDSTSCNITIEYPDNTLLIDNIGMTNNVSFVNVTILEGQANVLGFYEATHICCDRGFCGKDTFEIAITGDGKPFHIFPTQFYVIILGFFLLTFGLFSEKVKLLKHLGSIIILIMGVLTLFPGYSFINYSTLLGKALGFTFVGSGFWFLIEDAFSKGKQEEYYTQETEHEL